MKTIHKISLATISILVVCLVGFVTIPFPKFEQMSVLRSVLTPDDKKGIFLERLWTYNHYKYVHKGMSFTDIPCYSNDGSNHVVDIRFNWDNSISVTEKDNKTILHIDSISIEKTLSYGAAYMIDGELRVEPVQDDEFFESISFYDSKQVYDSIPYSVTLFRQERSLPNGPHRYGFELYINKKLLRTGNEEKRHIFEY
jgi:hypothetical protein